MRRILSIALRYWHLLSLDAPTVAALWCWAFAVAARQHLAAWLPIALALGTWLFYVADRLLDARLAPAESLQPRHLFHQRHRIWFLLVAVPVSGWLGFLIAQMPRSLLLGYGLLGALSLVYLAFVHLPAWSGSAVRRFPKEFAVGLLFSAATALPAWDEAQRRAGAAQHHHPLLLLCPVFAALCWLNCMAIDEWEAGRRGDRAWRLAAAVAAGSLLCLGQLFNAGARELAALAAISALSYLLLDRSRLTTGARRIAADLVLLTPLLLLAAVRLRH